MSIGWKLLVLVHVLSAILGVGPAFFGQVLVRRKQTLEEYRHALELLHRLENFPKIGGTIAVVSGLALVIFFSYGSFLQLWLVGSLILYILIQVIMIGRVAPLYKRLLRWLSDESVQRQLAVAAEPGSSSAAASASMTVQTPPIPAEQARWMASLEGWYAGACVLGTALFVFMIVKP